VIRISKLQQQWLAKLQEQAYRMQQQQQQAMHSIHDPQLHTPILRHPSISQNQQAVVQLQLVSKELQAAVAQLLAGQVPVALDVQDKQQLGHALTLVQWLQKHAGLLRTFDLQLQCGCGTDAMQAKQAAVVSQLEAALQQAAAANALQLQSFCLKGSAMGASVLQHLPASHLTRLRAEVDVQNSANMQAIAALSGLRSLQLISSDTAAAPDNMLAPLAHLQ
jgi:hypothetical protein